MVHANRAHKVQNLIPNLLSRATCHRRCRKKKTSVQDPKLGGDAGEATEVAVRVRFSEDRNFEPPQGSLEVIEVGATSKAR